MATKKKPTRKKRAKKKISANSAGIPRGQGRKKAKKKTAKKKEGSRQGQGGGAPKGNRFWEMRSSHGRKPIFSNPDDLLDACIQYFKWCEENPLMETRVASANGYPTLVEIPKMRALTMEGLYIFVDINKQTWSEYKQKEDFSAITGWVEDYIREQKFTGAAAGFLNANIIARDLGLKDASDVNTNSTVTVIMNNDDQETL